MGSMSGLKLWMAKQGNKLGRAAKDIGKAAGDVGEATVKAGKQLAEKNPGAAKTAATAAGIGIGGAAGLKAREALGLDDDDDDDIVKKIRKKFDI